MHFAKWKKSGWKSYMSEWVSKSHLVVSDSLWPHGLQSSRPLCPWDSPGKNTGVGSHSLLQGIFPTQGSNQVSHIAGRFFTSWATREAWKGYILNYNFIFIMLWNHRDGKQISGCQALKNEWGIWLQKATQEIQGLSERQWKCRGHTMLHIWQNPQNCASLRIY